MIWKHLKKHKGLLALALILAAINQIFSLLDPQIFRLIIDNYATKIGTISTEVFIKGVFILLLGSIGVALVSRIAKNFQDYFVSYMTQKIGTEMYAKSVEHTFSLPYAIFEDQRSGEILQKLQKARTDTQSFIANIINVAFLSLVGIIFVIIYAFTVNWIIGLAYLLIIPIIASFTIMMSRKIKNAQKAIVTETSALAGSTTETLRNVELVKSLGLEGQEIQRLNIVNDKVLSLELKKIILIRKMSFLQGSLLNIMRVSLLFLMLWLMVEGKITLGEFFSLYVYSFFIFTPLSEIGNIASSYQEAKASTEKLSEILKIQPEAKPKSPILTGELKSIELKKVSFKYQSSDKDSIKEASLSIKAGETLAFVGPSGSGKTTLIKLLVGLYEPTKGNILINGIDSKKINYENLRNKIGLVSQETQLFAGTIRENLLFINPKATDKECLEVLKLASITNILDRGKQGLNTVIGEGGIKLSGGERQRLAIARALLRKPELIIFDEATSSLDSLTEKEITETIQDIIKARPHLITVLIAHRLSTVARADKIYVLENGNIVEQGSHSSLLKKHGLYSALWREQAGKNNGNGKETKKE